MKFVLSLVVVLVLYSGNVSGQAQKVKDASKAPWAEFCTILARPDELVGKQVKADVFILISTADALKDPIGAANLKWRGCETGFTAFEFRSAKFRQEVESMIRTEIFCVDGANPWNCGLKWTFLFRVEKASKRSGNLKGMKVIIDDVAPIGK